MQTFIQPPIFGTILLSQLRTLYMIPKVNPSTLCTLGIRPMVAGVGCRLLQLLLQ
jgi:hypothetical protein